MIVKYYMTLYIKITVCAMVLLTLFLQCSCKEDFLKRDKAVTSSSNIADTKENIYFIKDSSIYIINKKNLRISDSGLKGNSVYTFQENLFYLTRKDIKNFIFIETDRLLSLDYPVDGFIVTNDFIYINGTYVTGNIYNYDRKSGNLSETSEKINGFPVISEDESTVYMMRTFEGKEDESGHVPVNHILSLNGNDLGSFNVYDYHIAFNCSLYIYKDSLYYADLGVIYEVNLVFGNH